jgi:hypothetical protein
VRHVTGETGETGETMPADLITRLDQDVRARAHVTQ